MKFSKPPKFEFTREGYEKLQKESADIKEKRKDAVELLKRAREMGDLSENSAYKVARSKLNSIDSRLRHLTLLLTYAHIVEAPPVGTIGLASKVLVDDGKGEKEFTIVGGFESDISAGKISSYSPIGKALMGKKVGDEVKVKIPVGEILYRVVKLLN